jgi:hypothetical protein
MLDGLERLGSRAPRLVYGLLGRARVDALRARLLARASKRLDVVAGQMAHLLHLSKVDVRGRTCLELGSGWVLSHALVLHLLGARAVIATDLEAQAHAPALADAVKGATLSIVRDVLSPFEDHGVLRARLERLASLPTLDPSAIGLDYVAPLDLARARLGRPVDLVFSNSVLEHVDPQDLPALLGNLALDLAPGGAMLHAIHLEDHRDARAPFAFLAEGEAEEPAARGNRLRASRWLELFRSAGLDPQVVYAWQRDPALLPAQLARSVEHQGVDDLRTSHLGLVARRA